MVGAAVAVATGVYPLEFLRACMAIPSRVRLPRAPPHTLVLTNAKFDHARLPSGAVVPDNLPPVLALAEAGEAARQCVQPISLPHPPYAHCIAARTLTPTLTTPPTHSHSHHPYTHLRTCTLSLCPCRCVLSLKPRNLPGATGSSVAPRWYRHWCQHCSTTTGHRGATPWISSARPPLSASSWWRPALR
jgi:hypothetical protein